MNSAKDYLRFKADLLLSGIKIGSSFNIHHRALMSSISEGLNIHIAPSIFTTVSINEDSPYSIHKEEAGFKIKGKGQNIEITLIENPDLRNHKTKDGTLLEKVGTIQIDRARISAFKGCIFGALRVECKFCEIGDIRRLRKNKLEHISEFVNYLESECPSVKHYLVSGGTPPDLGWPHFINVCKEIRAVTSNPIYAMFSPPPKLNIIDEIVRVGVTEIAINLEFFNQEVANEIIPGKAMVKREDYNKALERSVKLLGNTGQVRSILIVGIEDYKDTLRGVEHLASMGVAPILSIFKPLKGTQLENQASPRLEDLVEIWEKAQEICSSYSINLGPNCIYCQNNTLTVPMEVFESRY